MGTLYGLRPTATWGYSTLDVALVVGDVVTAAVLNAAADVPTDDLMLIQWLFHTSLNEVFVSAINMSFPIGSFH